MSRAIWKMMTSGVAMTARKAVRPMIPVRTKGEKEELRDESGKKLNTFEYSYWLYNQGNTVEQIAEKRGLNPITIEGHLARYVASGDLDVHEFVDADTLEKVEAYCEKHPEEKALKPIFEHFDAKISYGVLRMAIAAIRKE